MSDSPLKPTEESHHHTQGALSASDATGVVDAIDRHRTKILAAIAASAIGICAALVVGQLKKQKHLDASEAYTSAAAKGEIAALDEVLVNFPGSVPAGNALLTKAEVQIDQGKSEDARATLEKFTTEFKDHPRYAQGLFSLGNLFHLSGDAAKAKGFYEQTIEAQKEGELAPLARIRLGDLALEGGDKKLADQLYQESFTLSPDNAFADYAEQKIALLKIGNPPVVERPAPEIEEAPKIEDPKSETPAVEVPATETPAAAPATETPAADAPVKTPKAKGPKAGTPKAGETEGAAPKAKAPKAGTPKADAPKADAPKAAKEPTPPAPAENQ